MSRWATFVLLLAALTTGRADVIEISQGTNLSLAVDPARETIVVDLLGGLWRLPVAGGGATALIPAGSGIAQPRFAPTGERIVFQRWLDGQWDIWQLSLADGHYEPLTETPFDEREPDFSPDGRHIAFAGNRSGSYQIWTLDLENGALRQLTDEVGDNRFPTYSGSGEIAYINRAGERSSLRLYAGGPRGIPVVESIHRLDAPSWRPGGGVVVFNERIEGTSSDLALYIEADEPVRRALTQAEDVFVGRVAWLSPAEYVYAADGQLWRRGIASTERAPVHLFAGAAIDAMPADTVSRPLDSPGPHRVAGIGSRARHEPSGRVAFTALGDLWLADGDDVRRLTDDPATNAWPDFTPDGESVIFASDRGGDMQVWRLNIDTGEMAQLTMGTGRAFLPKVSGDGRYIAYLETAGLGPWDAADLELVPFDGPAQTVTLATGLYDASDLAWQGTQVRLLARAASAREPLARVFDTPAGDSPLRPESNAPAFTLPDRDSPTWRPLTADEPYVIQAARLFDGIRDRYTYLVDIHIEGQRITDIVRRGRLPLPDRVIDAGESTVVPGLIDVHVHQSTVAGAALGRIWLGHGITTVREVMANLPGALERAETWDSGRQPGPRLVISPAAPAGGPGPAADSPIVVTGGRIARGLTHGIAEQMARADVPLASLPPVLASARTNEPPGLAVSTLGRSYQDVITQLSASGAWLPTGLAALDSAGAGVGIADLTGTVERVMRSSGRIAIGSDAPAVEYGAGFHEELALLEKQGIPRAQILRWATAGGAIALGLSLDLGTLEPGRLADLVIVDGDPLDDIADLRQIDAVVSRGVWYDRSDLE